VRIEADAQRRAVLEDHAPRAFNLDREQVGRIPEPADFESLTVERAGLDRTAVVIRHQSVILGAATDPHTLVRKYNGAGLVPRSDQVPRSTVERDWEFGAGKARARNNWLKIAGQKSLGLAQARDANGLKILLEEDASGICILRP
jgi:hypothetical protein